MPLSVGGMTAVGRGVLAHRVDRLEAVAGVVDDGLDATCRSRRTRPASSAPPTVTPPAVSANTPVVRASSRMPSRISSSSTAAIAPPVVRTASSAYGPSAGLPMLSDFAMPVGLTGIDLVDARRRTRSRSASSPPTAHRTPSTATASTRPAAIEFLERLVDLRQHRAGRHRRDVLPGQPPAELLGHLVAERLRSLGVVRPDVDVDEAGLLELVGLGQLGAQPVDVVVGALDADERAAVDRGLHDLRRLEVGRHEHDRRHADARGVRGDRVAPGCRSTRRRCARSRARARR